MLNNSSYAARYNSTKRKRYSWNMSLTERQTLDEYCKKYNLTLGTLLKELVNSDAEKRGDKRIFVNMIDE